MEITGKIIVDDMPEAKGKAATGREWRRKSYVLEFLPEKSQYERHFVFDLWSDDIDKYNLQKDNYYTVSFEFSARKFKDRYYNSVNVNNVVPAVAPINAAPAPVSMDSSYNAAQAPVGNVMEAMPEVALPTENNGDLPF